MKVSNHADFYHFYIDYWFNKPYNYLVCGRSATTPLIPQP